MWRFDSLYSHSFLSTPATEIYKTQRAHRVDFERTLPEHRADSWAAALAPVMAWLRTRKVYDAELRAFGATDPGGGLPLPADEASHPHGSHGFMGLPRLCTMHGRCCTRMARLLVAD